MKRTIALFLLLAQLLTGCVAAVVAGAATGLIVYDRRSVAMIERDARIYHLVHKVIVSDSRFTGSRIVVTVFNQSVLLTGQIRIASLRVLAEKLVRNVPYVKRVYNEITIDDPRMFAEQSQDALITAELRAKLVGKKGLESGSIRIVTENGVVYLVGMVSQQQANLATEVARQTQGVRKVVKVFQYIR